jgi:transposase InsO family protein
MIRYCSRRAPDAELRARLRELANERRRFGYRRLFILLRPVGEPSGINRIHRLYREEGLAARKRWARRKALGTRAPIPVEAKPNGRTHAGRWTSSTTSSPTDGASAFSTLSTTTSPRNAWALFPRRRSRDGAGAATIALFVALGSD